MTDNNDEHSLVDQVLQDFVSPWQAVAMSNHCTNNEEFSADGIPLGVESDIQHLDLARIAHHRSTTDADASALTGCASSADST